MNKNEKFVITINRELGSGGRTIGRKLAQKLGVGFYDTIVINGLQEKFHLSVEEIEKLKGQKQGWWAEFKRTLLSDPSQNAHYYMPIQGGEPIKLFPETLFQTETEILKGIAESESCVVAGRSGFFVLRNHPNYLSIMIKASMEHRLERVMRTQNMTKEEALKTIKKIDKMRENYVQEFTKTSRYDLRNYDLVFSTDGKTEDEIVDQILMYIG